MKTCTLVFLKKSNEEMLLAMKKRSFGKGKWNGVGGKVMNNETIKAAAVRETYEEIGVTLDQEHLQQVAILDFQFKDNPAFNQTVHVFFIEMWQGDPIESEEMRPQWFNTKELPYDSMWVDDKYWLPHTLAGSRVEASFIFDAEGKEILAMDIGELSISS